MNTSTMKYASLDLGTVEAVFNKLGGLEGARRFLSGEHVVKVAERIFAVWKTITLGTCKDADEYRKAFGEATPVRRISQWGDDILGKTACATESTEVDLVNASVADLGFTGNTRYEDICKRITELGYELCTPEVGPALRLAYGDQPKDEWLRVAMDAITGSGGGLGVFAVDHDDGELWLDWVNGHPDDLYDPDRRFVFVRPRK